MPAFEFQQDFDKVVENLDASTALKSPTTTKSIQGISKVQCQEQIKTVFPDYTPPIDTIYRKWKLRNLDYQSLSPVCLFLLFFQPIIDIIVHHTNIAAKRDSTIQKLWTDVTDLEIRRWVAYRL